MTWQPMITTSHHFAPLFHRSGRAASTVAALLWVSACSSGGSLPSVAALPSPSLDGPAALEKLADSDLRDMRGGMRIGTLDLSIGAEIATTVSDGVALVSKFAVDDAGKLHAAASPSPQPSAIGNAGLVAVAGNSATTQVVHQILNNDIATVVSNRVNNATINQVMVLDIAVRNFALQQVLAARVGELARVNATAGDFARFH